MCIRDRSTTARKRSNAPSIPPAANSTASSINPSAEPQNTHESFGRGEIKGTFHEVKGKVKETVGQVTNNPDLEAEGKAEHRAGKVEKKVGQIKKVFEQ